MRATAISVRVGFYAAGEPDCYPAAAAAVDVTETWDAARWREVAYNPLGSTAIRVDAKCELASDTLRLVLQIAGSDFNSRRRAKDLVAELDVAVAENASTGPTTIRHEDAAIRFQDDSANDRA